MTEPQAKPKPPSMKYDKQIRVGQWNIQRDHPVEEHVDFVLDEFEEHNLDILLIMEAKQYENAFARRCKKRGLDFFAVDEERGQNQNCAIAKPGLVDKSRLKVLADPDRTTWFTGNGSEHAPVWALVIYAYGIGWLIGDHHPVAVKWTRGGKRTARLRLPHGPANRVVAYVKHQRRLRQFFKNHGNRPVGVFSDFNCQFHTRGLYTPRWLADQVNGRMLDPKEGTHGKHSTIDYGVVRGLKAAIIDVLPRRRSDHSMLIWRVEVDKDLWTKDTKHITDKENPK